MLCAQAEPAFLRARLRMATCQSRLGTFSAALAVLEPPDAIPASMAAAHAQDSAGKRADVEDLQEHFSKVLTTSLHTSSCLCVFSICIPLSRPSTCTKTCALLSATGAHEKEHLARLASWPAHDILELFQAIAHELWS